MCFGSRVTRKAKDSKHPTRIEARIAKALTTNGVMKNRLIGFAAVCVAIPAMLVAQQNEKKQLAGVWKVEVAELGQSESSLLSLAMFGEDGSFTTAVGYKSLPPIAAVQDIATEIGPGYGGWAAVGQREFRLTFYSVMLKAGLVNGFQRVQTTLVLSESGDEYIGHAQVDFLDANWNVLFSTTSDVKGTRLETPATLLPWPAGKKQLVGVWEDKMVPADEWRLPLPLLSLAMFGGNGYFTTAGGHKALPPVAAVQDVANEIGPGFGRSVATGAGEFHLTFYCVIWKAGLVNGFERVRDALVLSESGDEYTGQAQVDFLDANWNVVFSTTSDMKGIRLETPGKVVAQPVENNQPVMISEVKVWPIGQSQYGAVPLLSISMTDSDGSFTTTPNRTLGSLPALQDVANELGPGYGHMAITDARELRLTFYSLLWKAGLVNGFQRVRVLAGAEPGQQLAAPAQVDFLDANWNVVLSTTSDAKGTKLETPGPD
jgi:hypothetical protein